VFPALDLVLDSAKVGEVTDFSSTQVTKTPGWVDDKNLYLKPTFTILNSSNKSANLVEKLAIAKLLTLMALDITPAPL
jgi:hypothetical protein